jgi:hypothetical protein
MRKLARLAEGSGCLSPDVDGRAAAEIERQAAPLLGSALKRFNFEKVGLRGRDLLANPCREMAARRIHFAVARQSQA